MTGYEPGDFVLVPHPLDRPDSGRQRPALVISSANYNQVTGELIIAQVTGRLSAPPRIGDSPVFTWQEANLSSTSLVRSRLATVKASLVIRPLGRLNPDDFQAVLKSLYAAVFE